VDGAKFESAIFKTLELYENQDCQTARLCMGEKRIISRRFPGTGLGSFYLSARRNWIE
jgi:hypothetical protein